jgi:pyruvate formate lyase activating enzyme
MLDALRALPELADIAPKGDDGSVSLRYVKPATVVSTAIAENCPGIAYTYNEPVIWLEYVLDVGRIARESGLFNVMVTNGYVTPEGLDAFAEVIDVWRVDIKGFSEEAVRKLCHVGHASVIREQAVRAKREHGMHVECVTNVVPTINDSEEELRAVAQWISRELGSDTPWHVTRFMPYLEFADLSPTPLSTLERAREIGHEAGLRFVYLGNVESPGGEDTICPNCGDLVVRRRGFDVLAENLTSDGACGSCGAPLGIRMDGCEPREGRDHATKPDA